MGCKVNISDIILKQNCRGINSTFFTTMLA